MRFAVQVEFIVEAPTEAAAIQTLKDHLSITYAGEYNQVADIETLNDLEDTHMLPITYGVVTSNRPERAMPMELTEPHFEGSRFIHDS